MLDTCSRSVDSTVCGMRRYAEFASAFLPPGKPNLPPSVEMLQAWSANFRCHRTFGNYIAHVKTACMVAGVATDTCDHPAVKRARQAIAKRGDFRPRAQMHVDLKKVEAMVESIMFDSSRSVFAMLCLTAYTFLLRVPSECLPLQVGKALGDPDPHALVEVAEDCIKLKLARRKNRMWPTELVRRCWCKRSPSTCPVHVLGHWLAAQPNGSKPFVPFSPCQAAEGLRAALVEQEVPGSSTSHHAAICDELPCYSLCRRTQLQTSRSEERSRK